MNAKKTSAVLACAALSAASGLAHAGAVSFHVPLNVTSYPGPNVEVWCELRTAQDQPIDYLPQEAGAIRRYRCALVVESKSTLGAGLGSGAQGKMYGVKSIPVGATILQQVSGPLQ
jgi:hypothetical protein